MPGIVELLSHIDTAKLTVHLEAANGTVKLDLAGSLDPRELLGDFGKLLASGDVGKIDPQQLGTALTGMIGELGQLGQTSGPGLIADVAAELEKLVKLFEGMIAQFGGDGSIVDRLLEGAGGLEKLLGDVSGRLVESLPLKLPDSVETLFATLRTLGAGGAPDSRQAAELLARFLMGLDLRALGAPAHALEDFFGRIRVAGGDLGGLHLEMQNLTLQVRSASALLLAPQIDVAAAGAALTGVRTGVELLLNNSLAGAVAKVNQDLAAINPDAFVTALRGALGAFPAAAPGVKFDLEQDLVTPLRALAAAVDRLTPEALTAMFQEMKEGMVAAADHAGIQDMLTAVDGIFDIIIDQMRRVPLRQLRDELINALIALEAKIRGLPALQTPHLFGEQIQTVRTAIAKVDTASIQQKVNEFAAKIDDAAKKFPIHEIKDEVSGLIDTVKQALDQFKPALDALGKQLDDLGKEIEGIDFSAAGQASIGLIKDIRANVEKAVGSGDLPEPAKLAIGTAAGALKGINVTVEVGKPFDDALAQIDPKIVLAPIDPALAKVREVLGKVSPQALIDQLDKPFQDVLAALEKLKPAALLAGLSAEFAQFTDLVGKLDPRALVAPLEAEFQKAIDALRSALDPAPLFAPLREAYAKLQQLIDLVDLEKVFGRIFTGVAGLPATVADALHGAAAQHVPGTVPAAAGDRRDLKFGDILRPLIALIAQVKRAIIRMAEHLIGEALALLETPLGVLRRLAEGGHSLLADVAQEIDKRLQAVDIFAASGPAVELRAALTELQLISAGLSGNAQASLGPLTASVSLDAHVGAIAAPWDMLQATGGKIRESLAVPALVVQLQRLDDTLLRIIPAPLRDGSLPAAAADKINALFDALDLTPVAAELDALGDKIQTKLLTLANDVANNIIDLWNSVLDLVSPLLPVGLIKRVQDGMQRIRAELTVLDPAPIQAEVAHLLDVVLGVLNNFSPTKLVADLGGIIDDIRAQLATLDPAKLLGQLDPIAQVIDNLRTLKPSVVLAPLLDSTKELTAALEALTKVPFGDALIQATAKLKAALQAVVEAVEQELKALLDYLEGLSGGGGVSVSVSASAG
jgi:hypothetical protein